MKSILWFLSSAVFCFSQLVSSAAADEKEALAAIEKLGGSVRGVALDTDDLEIDFHLQGDDLTDDGLVHLAGLKKVVNLHLGCTQVTDAGLVHLRGLSSLRRLHLEKTEMGDAGLAHLKGLANLEYLNLYDTAVTDKGLEQLVGLKKLRRLYLWQTKTTDAGVARLQKALPNLVINTGADLSALPPPKPPKKLSNLKWIPATTATPPKSRSGPNLTLHFENKSKKRIKLYWVSYGGDNQLYGVIEPGKTRRQNTYTTNTWLVCDDQDHPLGYFISEKGDANAVIPSDI